MHTCLLKKMFIFIQLLLTANIPNVLLSPPRSHYHFLFPSVQSQLAATLHEYHFTYNGIISLVAHPY